jgi:hypothetical protein
MAIQGGPDIVEDGLVLHLDAAEPLCFRGEPTTNVVANPNPTSGWGGSNAQGSTITRSFLTENGVPFMRFSGVTNGSDYPRVTDSVFTNSATITGSFSTSLEARGTSGAQIRLRIYDNGSTKITNTITLTNEWVRYKFENQSTSFALNQPYFNPVTTGATYDIRNIQIEAKPYSTSFVVGTRGSTVATGGGLLDLTNNGNNGTINRAASPSAAFYNGDNKGSLVFNGNDFIQNDSFSITPQNNELSICLWVNSNNANNSMIIDLCNSDTPSTNRDRFSIRQNWSYSSPTAFRTSFYFNSSSNNFQYTYLPEQMTANTWNHIGYTKRGNAIYGYLNGQQVASKSVSGNIAAINRVIIGNDNISSNKLNGKVSLVSVYDHGLSADEIRQNYNATKGRFGL